MEQQENELEQARREIDAVDAEMAALFCRRMDAVRRVAAYKQARGLSVLDASREEAVVAKNCARLPDETYAEYYEDFIRHTMGLSRAFQRAVLGMGTVAYQGVEGAFSHIALTRLFQHVRAQAYPTWAEVFDAVAGGDAPTACCPLKTAMRATFPRCWTYAMPTGISACATYTTCPSARICWAFRARICRT